MSKFKHEIGLVARDKITGFRGVITGRAQYITGCDQYLLQPQINEIGNDLSKYPDATWFDEGRVMILPDKGVAVEDVKADNGSGPDKPAPIK